MKKITCTLLFCLLPLAAQSAEQREYKARHGHWHTSKSTDPLDNLSTVYRADLEGVIQDGPLDKKKVHLTVRCQNKKARLMINWYKFLGEHTVAVSHAIDGEPADTSQWEVVGSKTTAALPVSPALFLQRMVDGNTLRVNVTPFRGHPLTALFYLDGAQKALEGISQDCH